MCGAGAGICAAGRHGARSDHAAAVEAERIAHLSALLSQGSAVQTPNMKRRDDQITFRLSGPLRAALEAEAAAESTELSNLIRKILVDHAAQRVVERETQTAA